METGARVEPAAGATCVVWCPSGTAQPPRPLVEALAARGFEMICCDDAFEAFARLCVCVGGGEPGRRAVSLVVVGRDRLDGLGDFLEAVETYTPAVVPWDYDDAGGLKPLVVRRSIEPGTESGAESGADLGTEQADESVGERLDFARAARASAPPRLRISEPMEPSDPIESGDAGERSGQDEPSDAQTDASGGASGDVSGEVSAEPTMSELLTDEELAMLLGDDGPSSGAERGETP